MRTGKYCFTKKALYRWLENLSNSAIKRKIMAITAFKVVQGHRGWYQSKARMRFSISD